MPKQDAAPPEPFSLGHNALSGLTVGPEADAVQRAGGVVGLEHLEGQPVSIIADGEPTGTQPEPLRPIDPKGDALKPGTKIE